MSSDLSASEAIEAMKRHLLVDTDERLASVLGVSSKTISSWRTRNQIPFRILAAYQFIMRPQNQRFSNIEEMPTDIVQDVIFAATLFFRDRYRDLLNHETRADSLMFWAELHRELGDKILAFVDNNWDQSSSPQELLQSIIDATEKGDEFDFSVVLGVESKKHA